MRRTRVVATLACSVTIALAHGPARAADPDVAHDVDALLEVLRAGNSYRPRGDSPTARLARVLRRGRRDLAGVLAARWEASVRTRPEETPSGPEPAVEQLAHFVYGLDLDRPALRIEGGAVVLAPAQGAGSNDPGQPPSFKKLTAGAKPMPAPKTDLFALLALAEEGLPQEWSRLERVTFGMSLGEACRPSAAGRGKLAELARGRPDDEGLIVALGWSGDPDATRSLRTSLTALAAAAARGDASSHSRLELACAALAHADPAALESLLAELPDRSSNALLGVTPLAVGLPFALRLGAGGDEDGRSRGAVALRSLMSGRSGGEGPPAGHVAALVRQLARNLEDPALSAMTIETAEHVFHEGERRPVSASFGIGSGRVREEGERLGAYPDTQAFLCTLVDDVDRGHAVFVQGDAAFFASAEGRALTPFPPGGLPPVPALRSRRRCPVPPQFAAKVDEIPLRLTGKLSGSVLDLTLSNEDKRSFTINPVALRYCAAEWTTFTERIERDGGEGEAEHEVTNLYLELGVPGTPMAVENGSLLELVPGATYTWSLYVRAEHRDADRISVALAPGVGVLKKPRVRFVEAFSETWVK